MHTEQGGSFQSTAWGLLPMRQCQSAVHRPEGHLGVNLVKARIGPGELRHVKDPRPESVRLRRDAEARAEGLLEELPGRRGEDGACRAAEKRAGSDVGPARAESDRDVDRKHRGVSERPEVRLDGTAEEVSSEAALLENYRDPAALGSVDPRNTHA